MTLSLNNVKNLISGQYAIDYKGEMYSFESAQLNEEFKKYAEANGLQASLQEPVVKNGSYYNTVTLGASLNGDGYAGLSGDMPIVDVSFKVKADEWYYGQDKLNVTVSKYTKAGTATAGNLPYYSTSYYDFVSKHADIQGNIRSEAFPP